LEPCQVKIFTMTRKFWVIKFKKMHKIETIGNWEELKAKLKQKFRLLTDNDLMFEKEKNEEMLAKLEVKLGKTKEELRKIIASL